MFQKTKVSKALLFAFGGSLALSGVSALAQTQAAPAAEPQRIEVTGSRIRSLNADSASPLQVLTSEDIAASGATNIQELLLKNPTFGSPSISRTNSNFSTSSAGVAVVDLRNLGTARTLVLVNGRRFVAGVPGDSAVDLNSIPTQFIEKVEILTGGSSSAYGSDAVAGVVNIILKKDFEGLAFDAKYGESAKSDDRKQEVNMTFGATSANGRGNVMGHIGLSKQGSVFSRDRSASDVDQASLGAFFTGLPEDMFTAVRPFYSSFAPQGRFRTTNEPAGGITFDAAGNVIPWSTNGPAGDGVDATGFNRSAYRTIAIPTDRFLFAGKGEYEFTENHRAFFEGTYAGTKTKTELEPFPLSSEDIFPATGGQVPAEFLVNGVLVRNPLVPDSIYNTATDTDGDGLRDYFFTRRISEVGNRGSTADRDTFRIVTGVKGLVFGGWDYEAFAAYGSTKESQVSGGQVNVLNFRNALEAITDPVSGQAVCRDLNAQIQGCVPINIFGLNTISPEALKYVSAPQLLSTFTSQKLVGASITGELAQLPAGPLGLAVGGEYRKEFSRSEFDALTQAGLNAGNAIPRTEGGFDVKELYAEVKVPLLKDQPFAKRFDFTAAMRGGKYSTVGSTTSWNAGVEWEPVSSFKVRGTHAVSTRAPNINELFSPPSQDFPTGLVDPCLGVTLTSTTPASEACRADPGVRANIVANGAFTLNQPDLQGVSGFNRGNPLLNDEKGTSWSLGLTFSPVTDFGNFSATLDYFDIKIEDAIVSTPRQFILDQCYTGDASLCQFITRRPRATGQNSAGSLDLIDSGVTNSGGVGTKGVDVTLGYVNKVGPGQLRAELSWTHLLKLYAIPLPGADPDSSAGEVGASKDKGFLTLGYKWGNFGVTAFTTYIGPAALDDQFLAGYGLAPGSVGVKAKIYNDFQFTYAPTKTTELFLGIDNAFDVKAPPIISGLPGNDTGAETDAGTYDAIGRRYNVGIRFSL